MECRLLHFCTNDYHFFLTGLSSFAFLYEWLPFLFEWIVVIYISVRMTTISFWMDCRHLHFCTKDYHFFLNWFVVIYISVQMTTISFWMDFLYVHFYTDDYLFILNGFSSFTFLYGRIPSHFEFIFVLYISVLMTTFSFWFDFRHVHFCTDDYHFFFIGLSSCTFLYGWLPSHFKWIFFMYISVRMTTISLYMGFRRANFVQMNFNIFVFGFSSCIICANDFQYSFGFPWCVQCSSTRE